MNAQDSETKANHNDKNFMPASPNLASPIDTPSKPSHLRIPNSTPNSNFKGGSSSIQSSANLVRYRSIRSSVGHPANADPSNAHPSKPCYKNSDSESNKDSISHTRQSSNPDQYYNEYLQKNSKLSSPPKKPNPKNPNLLQVENSNLSNPKNHIDTSDVYSGRTFGFKSKPNRIPILQSQNSPCRSQHMPEQMSLKSPHHSFQGSSEKKQPKNDYLQNSNNIMRKLSNEV